MRSERREWKWKEEERRGNWSKGRNGILFIGPKDESFDSLLLTRDSPPFSVFGSSPAFLHPYIVLSPASRHKFFQTILTL